MSTTATSYEVLHEAGHAPVKAWTKGVPFDDNSKKQLLNIAKMPFIHQWVAAMPDVHLGKGATIGSVIPTVGAIIPAAVGVDLGCGMMAAKTTLTAADLPDSLEAMRSKIEQVVPHGRVATRGQRDTGSWGDPPDDVLEKWLGLSAGFQRLCEKHPFLKNTNNLKHLGTLGTGNHFIEVCLDETQTVWVMLHSGSRGVGNAIGTHFIEQAKKDMERYFINLPDKDLAYIPEGSPHFRDYVEAVAWAQDFAQANRELMMARTLQAIREVLPTPFTADVEAVNCHHNYISREHHYGKDVWVTRKGAVSAQQGQLGIIPGSMGAKSFIVRGLGNAESFCSCSHGAGRVMSRTEAKRRVSLDEHKLAVAGVECRVDEAVIDETPSAYKPIDKVMAAQSDLVEVLHTLKQVVCVKG
ncbi:MAG TPA: RtcB family protein [Candidatus Thiothrix moscowensis]|uniref:RtcB family protein n=1 Tax=unclassified Thiothrix TaxID=2636184 RepID=UPI0025F16011|nr:MULTISPECIES: RtcB family protein [unclassified Thiothrix]HRJ51893.1 RtcB family protein [Candidatus Thiothrix moscowensis]HRJ92208.1 RtcB family protein [Candidatus Thiothrix moscowensis]